MIILESVVFVLRVLRGNFGVSMSLVVCVLRL